MKPLFSYPGQKAWLAPKVIDLFPDIRDRQLIELFGGSAALSFELELKEVLYNEAIESIVSLMKAVQLDPSAVSEYASLEYSCFAEENFYQHRERFNLYQKAASRDLLAQSGHLLHVARRGFNSTLRFNRQGLCNTPFRKVAKPVVMPTADELKPYSKLLEGWTIENQFADSLIVSYQHKPGAIFFLDPPYAGTATTYGTSWRAEDTLALLHKMLVYQDNRTFLITTEPNQHYADFAKLSGWQTELIISGRKYQSKNGTSEKPMELLIYNHSL